MEDAIVMGQYEHLVGVWSGAEKAAPAAVVMLTAGMLSSVGPYRLHVDLARRLAAEGVPSLRFDLSGIGDSMAIGADGGSLDRAASEVSQAIDWIVDTHHIKRIILFGLCSGADDAIAAALVDPRVVGVIAMDGCGYRTRRYYWHRLTRYQLPRLVMPAKWLSLAQRWFFETNDSPRSLTPGDDVREFPSREVAENQLQSLTSSGIRLHFLYTGGVHQYYNHEGQFAAMFPSLRTNASVTTCYLPRLDHVAYRCKDRQLLVAHIAATTQSFLAAH